MKKRLIICISIFLISMSLISASWIGDVWNKITGKAVTNENLISYYKFNGDSSDDVGANPGTTYGGLIYSSSGKDGAAAEFDGSNDFISISNENNFDSLTGGESTISFWMKQNDVSQTERGILQKRDANNYNKFFCQVSSLLGCGLWSTDSNAVWVTTSINNNEWTHIVITTSVSNKKISLYKNGAYVSNNTNPSLISTNNNQPLRIGYAMDAANDYFKGSIDELRVYNRVLSDAEIGELYSEGICEPNECLVGSSDCSVADCCGNNMCDSGVGENCSSCATDCVCDGGTICIPEIKEQTCGTAVCGNKTNNCGAIVDCGICEENKNCEEGVCVEESINYINGCSYLYDSLIDKISDLQKDEDYNVILNETQIVHSGEWVVIPGSILKLNYLKNMSTGYSSDFCRFTDVITGEIYETIFVSEGVGSLTIRSKNYLVTMSGSSTINFEDYIVTLDYPQTSGNDKLSFENCGIEEENLEISLATLKNIYSVGEVIQLTDPPEEFPSMDYSGPSINALEETSVKKDVEVEGYIVQLKEKPIVRQEIEIENQLGFVESK